MKIMVFSLGPIFNGPVHGGSQKALRDIAVGLGEKGHKIDIYCPRRKDNNKIFNFSENVVVKPILPFKGTYPAPYEVGPYNIYKACEILANEMKKYDILYIHDAELNIEFLKDIIPTVISLRDFCYGETLLGAINFAQSDIIVNSNHTYNCLLDSFNRINSNIKKNKVHLIYNGYDYIKFKKTVISDDFYRQLNLPAKDDNIIIGFPHRPDIGKGFLESIEVLEKLVIKNNKFKLLIPEYIDDKDFSSRTFETYNKIMNMIRSKHLEDNIIFHKWVSHDLMPQYFSYCDVILCIGNFCESFSNVSTESILCETPVIATNSATYRTIPIRDFLEIVDYSDIEQTVNKILEVISNGNSSKLLDGRNYIINNLNIQRCVDSFEKVFENAIKNFKYDPKRKINSDNFNNFDLNYKYHLAPWCYYLKDNICSDYSGIYEDNLDMIFNNGGEYTGKELISNGLTKNRIINAINDGIILKQWQD